MLIRYPKGLVRTIGNKLEYKPVTAYTLTRPVLVDGVDINTGVYPVLNYKPEYAQYPYTYVPIAEFSKVGARVVWDKEKRMITVVSKYKKLAEENKMLKAGLRNKLYEGGAQVAKCGYNNFIIRTDDRVFRKLTPTMPLTNFPFAVEVCSYSNIEKCIVYADEYEIYNIVFLKVNGKYYKFTETVQHMVRDKV